MLLAHGYLVLDSALSSSPGAHDKPLLARQQRALPQGRCATAMQQAFFQWTCAPVRRPMHLRRGPTRAPHAHTTFE
jgi:hypothetical protein